MGAGSPTIRSAPSIRKPSVYSLHIAPKSAPSILSFNKRILPILRVLVLLLVFYVDYLSFSLPVSRCRFPAAPAPAYPGATVEHVDPKSAFKVALLADPQLLDMRSYPGRSWILRKLGVWFTDNYLRKAWRFVSKTKGDAGGTVDAVIWLGDLLDSGVESVDRKEHSHYVHRFNLLFPLPRSNKHSSNSPPIPSILIPGNHDLGLHQASDSLAGYARERFQSNFGDLFGEKDFGGWSIVWVDSMGLLEDEEGVDSRKFVDELRLKDEKEEQEGKDIGKGWKRKPRVLLTHIPLWREEGTECGKDREHSRPIYQGKGKNYQNELDKQTSEWLLKSLGPNLVFSGDDHDSCQVTHLSPPHSPPSAPAMVLETTVKSLSMAMGVDRPGYSLLTLFPPSTTSTSSADASYALKSCLLPSQITLWLSYYLPSFILVFLLALIPKLFKSRSRRKRRLGRGGGTGGSGGRSTYSHNHSRSLSRGKVGLIETGSELFGAGAIPGGGDLSTEGSEEDEEDFLFPTFPFQNSGGTGGGYLSSLLANVGGGDGGDELLPTSNLGGGDLGRVRRVSRVWSWDPTSASGGGGGGGGGSGVGVGSSGRLLGRRRGVWWKVILWRVVAIPVRLLRVVGGNDVIRATCKEVGSVVGPGVVLWVLIWIWFAL